MEHVIGWRGHPATVENGTDMAAIERCWLIFAHHDTDDRRPTPTLNLLPSGIGYVYMTLERLREALRRHFLLTILLRCELPTTFDRETGEPIRDEVKAARLALGYADRFMDARIETLCFMPRTPQVLHSQHYVSIPRSDLTDGLEALVAAALSTR